MVVQRAAPLDSLVDQSVEQWAGPKDDVTVDQSVAPKVFVKAAALAAQLACMLGGTRCPTLCRQPSESTTGSPHTAQPWFPSNTAPRN